MNNSFKKSGKFKKNEFKSFDKKTVKPVLKAKVIQPLKNGKFEVNIGKFRHTFDDEAALIEWKRSQRMAKNDKKRPDRWCFSCRESGHIMSNCPLLDNGKSKDENSLFCFHCGESGHNIYKCTAEEKVFAFAKCFICNQTGHLSRTCPKGKQSVYPNGGCCHLCEKTDHLQKDCPLKCPKKYPNPKKADKNKICENSNLKVVGGDDDFY